jgi:HSP20 family protein
MDRLWDRVGGETPLTRTFGDVWLPSVDISETKDNFVVKAELPGLEAKDVNVSIPTR